MLESSPAFRRARRPAIGGSILTALAGSSPRNGSISTSRPARTRAPRLADPSSGSRAETVSAGASSKPTRPYSTWTSAVFPRGSPPAFAGNRSLRSRTSLLRCPRLATSAPCRIRRPIPPGGSASTCRSHQPLVRESRCSTYPQGLSPWRAPAAERPCRALHSKDSSRRTRQLPQPPHQPHHRPRIPLAIGQQIRPQPVPLLDRDLVGHEQ